MALLEEVCHWGWAFETSKVSVSVCLSVCLSLYLGLLLVDQM